MLENPFQNFSLNFHLSPETRADHKRKAFKSFKMRADAKRSLPEKFADLLTVKFGSIAFLTFNVLWFLIWIPWNMGLIPGVEPFDPFPFGLLTMVVSLEAIFLAIIVLISQNREARVTELREEFDLQINTLAEAELSKLIQLVLIMLKKQGVNVKDDPELLKLLGVTNAQIERDLEKELA